MGVIGRWGCPRGKVGPAPVGAGVEGARIGHVPPHGRCSIKVLYMGPDSKWKVGVTQSAGGRVICKGTVCVTGPAGEAGYPVWLTIPHFLLSWAPSSPASALELAASCPAHLAGEGGPWHWHPCQHQVWGCCLPSRAHRMDLSLGAGPRAPRVLAGVGWAGAARTKDGCR